MDDSIHRNCTKGETVDDKHAGEHKVPSFGVLSMSS